MTADRRGDESGSRGGSSQPHTMQQAGPATTASGRLEVEWAGATGVVALAGPCRVVQCGEGRDRSRCGIRKLRA